MTTEVMRLESTLGLEMIDLLRTFVFSELDPKEQGNCDNYKWSGRWRKGLAADDLG